MGIFQGLSLASRYPNRVKACIFANLYFFPQKLDSKGAPNTDGQAIADSFKLEDDGSHLLSIHNKRSGWLDPELNLRVVQTELTYLVNRRQRYSREGDIR